MYLKVRKGGRLPDRPNSAGKSTAALHHMRINRPTAEETSLDSQRTCWASDHPHRCVWASPWPQKAAGFPSMSVLENLLRGAYKPDTRKKRNELLEKSFISFPF